MKTIIILFQLCFILSCAQNSKDAQMVFQPKGKMTYQYEMKSDQMNMTGILNTDFKQENGQNIMDVDIVKISANSSDGKYLGYHEYEGNTYTRQYNNHGEATDLNQLPKQIINMDLFVVAFPNFPIKEGSHWKSKKTAKPDMFFDHIDVEYTCTLMKDDVVMVKADMVFKSADKLSSDMKMTRKFQGEYIIDPKDGAVTNAKLYMDMFSGFSQLSGTIEIFRQ